MKKNRRIRKLALIGVAVVIFLIVGASIPSYFTAANLLNVTRQSAPIALCALGMGVVLITKQMDLSTGGIMAFSAMVSGFMMNSGIPVSLSWLAGAAVGTLMGVLNGILLAKIEIPSFIATFVTGQIGTGVALIICEGRSLSSLPDLNKVVGNQTLGPVPYLTIIMLVYLALTSLVMRRTKLGKHFYALGGNELTLKYEGVDVDVVKVAAFAISGFCASSAGIFLSSMMNTVHPTQGSNYQLDAVAACAIGGISMLGGKGKPWMAVLGALIIGLLRNGLTLYGMHPWFQNLAIGTIIIVVVGVSVFNRNREIELARIF